MLAANCNASRHWLRAYDDDACHSICFEKFAQFLFHDTALAARRMTHENFLAIAHDDASMKHIEILACRCKKNQIAASQISFEPWHGELSLRPTGSLVADRRGPTTSYTLLKLQERGALFVGPGVEVYEGMIVGENARADDLDVNPTKERKLTNVRSSTAEELVRLIPPLQLSLEQSLEFLREDECAEVTPNAVRLRKLVLARTARARQRR